MAAVVAYTGETINETTILGNTTGYEIKFCSRSQLTPKFTKLYPIPKSWLLAKIEDTRGGHIYYYLNPKW